MDFNDFLKELDSHIASEMLRKGSGDVQRLEAAFNACVDARIALALAEADRRAHAVGWKAEDMSSSSGEAFNKAFGSM